MGSPLQRHLSVRIVKATEVLPAALADCRYDEDEDAEVPFVQVEVDEPPQKKRTSGGSVRGSSVEWNEDFEL